MQVCSLMCTSWRHRHIVWICLDAMCRIVGPLLALVLWLIDMPSKKGSHCFRKAIPLTVTTIPSVIFHIEREEEKGNISAILRGRLEKRTILPENDQPSLLSTFLPSYLCTACREAQIPLPHACLRLLPLHIKAVWEYFKCSCHYPQSSLELFLACLWAYFSISSVLPKRCCFLEVWGGMRLSSCGLNHVLICNNRHLWVQLWCKSVA